MKLMKVLLAFAWVAALAGCGGGGGNTLSGAGSQSSTVSTVAVVSSGPSVLSDGSTSVTITATAANAANVAVAGVSIAFSVSSGGVLAVTQGTTDANGLATATLKASNAAVGSTLIVTASAGAIKGSVSVAVATAQRALAIKTDLPQIPSDGSRSATLSAVLTDANNNAVPNVAVTFQAGSGVVVTTQGTTDANGMAKATLTAGSDPTNRAIVVSASAASATSASVSVDVVGSALSLSGPPTVVLGNTVTYTVALRDAGGHGIAGQAVTLTSSNGNSLFPSSLTTDVNGLGTVSLLANNVGGDTLTATGLGLVAKRALTVSSQSFNVTLPATGALLPLGAPQTVTATWLSAGAPVPGQQVTFTSTRGTFDFSTATTDGNGQASVHLTATTAGPAIITAGGNGVSAQTSVDFVATNPTQVAVQASPSTVTPNGSSVVTAIVRDVKNNLVEGQTVDFALTDSTGGTLSVATATTDGQGQAQTTYTAGASTSGANGVQITATVRGTAISGQSSLTVGGQTVYLSLGTGNTIESPTAATYSITYAVFAVDARGAPVAGAPVDLKVLPVSYVKGARVWNVTSSAYTTAVSTLPAAASCANEDVDYTGTYSLAKDYNGNGVLDPGNVAVVSPSSGTTAADGSLLVNVVYPKDHAYYVKVQLVATTAVTGTQSSTTSTFLLPYAAADFNQQSVQPPGPVSPYGTASTCANPN
jgi:Bacterial Ig-like domain (group 1)